jgi:hypothetical protein
MLFSGFSFFTVRFFFFADHGKLFLITMARWRERFEMRYHVLYFNDLKWCWLDVLVLDLGVDVLRAVAESR